MDSNIQTETESKRIQEIIDGQCLLDDNLMTLVFDGNIEATQLVLNIILERKDLIVKEVNVQKLEKNPLYNGRDVKLDILAEDAEGNRYNIEVQRESEGAGRTRARFNSAALDHSMLKHSQEFKEIKDSYIIFITEHDVFKKGRALTHVDRVVLEDNEAFGDGNHIIYVNAAYHDNSSDIGKLMHDFRCRNSEDMFYGPLRKGVHHFKETEGGRARMSKEIEEYADEKAIISVIDLAKDMKMTDQQIEDYLIKKFNLTRDEAKKYLAPAYV